MSSQKAKSKSAIRKRKDEELSEEETKQSQKLTRSRSNIKMNKSQISAHTQVVYSKGQYVAFVDPSSTNKFKIGHLITDYNEEDDEVVIDIYNEVAALTFQKESSRQPVPEYTLICDLQVVVEKSNKKGQKTTLKINKQQFNKANKHMDQVVQRIEQERSDAEEDDDEDDDEEEEEEEESDNEGEKEEDEAMMKKDSKEAILKRRIVKPILPNNKTLDNKKIVAAKTKPPTKAPTKSASPKKKAVQRASRSQSKLSRKSVKSQKVDDEDMESEKEQEIESEVVMIDTSSKQKRKRSTAAKPKKVPELPQVGQKRRRNTKKLDLEESHESEFVGQSQDVDDEDDDGDDEGASQPVKKRKMAGGKEKIVKPKKVVRRPTEFKKGKWNPDIELIKLDRYLESPSNDLFLECCVRCNNKNVIRAVMSDNENLLKKCINEKKKISSLTSYWSSEGTFNAIDLMVSKNQHNMLEIMLHPKVVIPKHSTYEQARDADFVNRANNPQYLMNFVDSGMVGHMAYGTRVRKVQMTRGNRQGNNAFLEYQDNPNRIPVYQCNEEKFLMRMVYNHDVDYETIKQVIKLNPNTEAMFQTYAYHAVRAGNYKVSYELIKNMAKHPNFGFNQLHVDVLSKDAVLDKILKVSVIKKANTCKDITPLFCACINPNPKFLEQLLEVGPDTQIFDQDLRRATHYAAACVTPDNLEILIKAGLSLLDVDNQKMTPMHIAAMMGRDQNVKIIGAACPRLINQKDKKGMTPMAYACKYGKTEVVKILFELKVRPTGCGSLRMTPLIWAAAYGHFDLCEYLVEAKPRMTLSKDKFKRTALILAVRNGYTKIASLLLQRGSEWYHQDSSFNTPLHYAAAYGWIDCINLLLKAGADVNSQNSWKISPINIAMLKNHQGCVKRLLEEPKVDVNGKDDKGRTLIMLSIFYLDDESEEFVEYLLKKGADPNIADLDGLTSLHYIAKYVPRQTNEQGVKDKQLYLRQIEIQKKITQILIQHGADLTIKDNMKRTPFTICLDADNAPLLEFLKDKVSINKEPDLFFSFKNKIFNVHYQKILERLILNDPPTKETINYLDDEGLTPFLRYIKQFADQYAALFTDIQNRINQQSFLHGANTRQYKLTNEDLFDKFADQTNFYTYNHAIDQEMKNNLTRKYLDEIIVEPFIRVLQFLISQGADETMLVQKLKKYRDIELQKNNMFAQLANGEDVKINKEEEEKVLRREEKMKKIKSSYGGKSLPTRTKFTGGLPQPGFPGNQNENEKSDVYDKIDGKKVLREYGQNGKRNAIHLIIKTPQQRLLDYLLKLKIDPDQPDYDEITAFNLMSRNDNNKADTMWKEAFDKLLDLEVRIDYPDKNGRTPFLNFYDQQQLELSFRMLAMGANVNQMDTSGLFALKYALIRRQNNSIEELLGKGANINQIDNKGRNLLHHAINMSSATADATFETEQFLIDRGVDINLRDEKLRTPLHYAFVKISDWSNSQQIDPIETVSSICGCKGLELDLPDKWQKTPLHYASQRGASICAMYLIQRGANMEKKDIYGNTPLGVGLTKRHYNYGIILIQKQASVLPLVHKEDPDRIKKMWEEEEKQKKLLYKIQKKGSKGDQEMEDEEDAESKQKTAKKKKHRELFKANKVGYYDEDPYGEEDDYDDEYDEEDQYQENVFNQQNAFGQQVYKPARKKATAAYNPYAFGGAGGFGMGGFNQFGGYQNNVAPAQTGDLVVETDKEGVSMFKLAIRGAQQGLAYLMLDNGYDLMHAMQDAMDEKKFMLVLTLLSKNPDDEVIQSKNSKGQNLFHILSMNASSCNLDHLKRIYDTLLKRGVDVRAKDNFGRNALHYAVIGQSFALVNMLLSQQNAYNPNEVDNEGFTPLALCLKGAQSSNLFYHIGQMVLVDNIFMVLVKNGADVNIVYPEDSYKPGLREEDVDEQYNTKGLYYCSPLINLIRQNPKNEIMRQNLIGLIEYGAKLDVLDSDGRDPIMHAIITNNTMVVKIVLENKKALQVNTKCQDKAGKSAVHYVVNPLRYGSFENLEILGLLHKYGFDFFLKDSHNRSPATYASEQESGVLLKELAKLSGQEQQLNTFRRQISAVDTQRWPEMKVDFENDADQYMDMAHDREKKLAKEKEFRVPVDKTGKFEKSYEVFYDDEDHPWDCYLTKVDLRNGIYGDYVFYKMQLLHDTNRDLYVVFTRYGRIGEPGMNQRTPFNSLDEAKQDYKKIFKQKTGGNNFDELDKFSRVKKKYNITRVNYITVNYQDYLQPFDYDKCPKSKLGSETFDLFEEISNVTMYQKAMTQFGLDSDILPFSAVKKESLVEARQILMEIQEALNEDVQLSKEGIKADFDALQAVKEKICELSSRYYELIPLERYKNQIAPPLNNQHLIKQQYDTIEGLTNIEFASKMLLGALFRQQEMNPVDYVYQALNLLIEPLNNDSGEFEIIKQYIDNTRTVNNNYSADNYEISNIFKLQRKGEAEMIQAYKDVPNHFLLFHGSAMFNFLGILSQGLRIAPPEAPPTGYMFGKGVYFADMFDKSFAYASRGYNQQDSYLMLMCEVALGKSKELHQAEYIEKLEHPYSSVKGCGRTGPGYKHTVICPNGIKIPLGKVIDYHENDLHKRQQLMLQHNEYIVYNTSQIRMRYVVQISKKQPKKK